MKNFNSLSIQKGRRVIYVPNNSFFKPNLESLGFIKTEWNYINVWTVWLTESLRLVGFRLIDASSVISFSGISMPYKNLQIKEVMDMTVSCFCLTYPEVAIKNFITEVLLFNFKRDLKQ